MYSYENNIDRLAFEYYHCAREAKCLLSGNLVPNRNYRDDVNHIGEVCLLIENCRRFGRDIHGDLIWMIHLEISTIAQKDLERMEWSRLRHFDELIDDHFG